MLINFKNGTYYGQTQSTAIKHGIGIFTWDSGITYIGQWKHDQIHGQGYFTIPGDSIIHAQLQNNKLDGVFKIISDTALSIQLYNKGKKTNHGVKYDQKLKYLNLQDIKISKDQYDKVYLQLNNQFNTWDEIKDTFSEINLHFLQNQSYLGFTQNSQPKELGVKHYLFKTLLLDKNIEKDNIYTGYFQNGKQQKQGWIHLTNGDQFYGSFKDGMMSGTGVYWIQSQSKWYCGNFKDNTCISIKDLGRKYAEFQNRARQIALEYNVSSVTFINKCTELPLARKQQHNYEPFKYKSFDDFLLKLNKTKEQPRNRHLEIKQQTQDNLSMSECFNPLISQYNNQSYVHLNLSGFQRKRESQSDNKEMRKSECGGKYTQSEMEQINESIEDNMQMAYSPSSNDQDDEYEIRQQQLYAHIMKDDQQQVINLQNKDDKLSKQQMEIITIKPHKRTVFG